MFRCDIEEDLGIRWIKVEGRIDSLNAPLLQREMHRLITSGERILVADLSRTSYLSSAGLRVLMEAFKQLKKVEGVIYFHRISAPVRSVFEMSNLTEIFILVEGMEEIQERLHGGKSPLSVVSSEMDGISVDALERDSVSPGEFFTFGSPDKLSSASYCESDVATVTSDEVRFATGLAALGEHYGEYKDLFGEAMTVQGNFFYYPAVNRPAVDYMLCSQGKGSFACKYLHGFGFNGDYRRILSFEHGERFVDLSKLAQLCVTISSADLLGIVLLAESKGFWGMHLKRSPISENRPANGKDIFAAENFTQWVNFPVEPGEIDHIIVACGIVARDGKKASARVQQVVGEGKNFHLHAGVFAREPLNRKIESFDQELSRIITELPIYKVQHALGRTLFSRGMAGIVELQG
ncbi:STAS domain-containing protein [Desulfoferrobacter suflitae]|uniref:STAS domain-containing protein n=1 Tax=Desulfoferrobacter suflitae TaxID=2865782 RepID=UPI00216451BD|nr:STAS domain-containing protein [Desulfoferrobacter suflitae]MCK8603162.1 STAS domain-containing protein [Desulfoferrobacter suflitae]